MGAHCETSPFIVSAAKPNTEFQQALCKKIWSDLSVISSFLLCPGMLSVFQSINSSLASTSFLGQNLDRSDWTPFEFASHVQTTSLDSMWTPKRPKIFASAVPLNRFSTIGAIGLLAHLAVSGRIGNSGGISFETGKPWTSVDEGLTKC